MSMNKAEQKIKEVQELSKTMSDEQKVEVLANYLKEFVGLEDGELEAFLAPEVIKSRDYKRAEKKIDKVYNSVFTEDEWNSQEIPNPMRILYLLGADHPLTRRIRNAYLPGCVSMITVDMNTGNCTEKSISDLVVRGAKDSVDKMDILLRRK